MRIIFASMLLCVLMTGMRSWMVCRHPRGDFETDSCYVQTMELLIDGVAWWRFRQANGYVIDYPKARYTIAPMEE